VARLAARGAIARQLAYWSVDLVIRRRRAREYDAVRVRWEDTKIVLASEHKLLREEKVMDYRSFVTQRARAGDLGAQRVLETVEARNRHARAPEAQSQPVTLIQLRERLRVIRAGEEARYEHARVERQHLTRIAPPPTIDEALASARKEIRERASEATNFIRAERAQLARLAKEEQSWNPFTRRAARKEAAKVRTARGTRHADALSRAMRHFEQHEAPRIEERVRGDEGSYRQYVKTSLDLESQVREARRIMRDDIPKLETRLSVLERAGVPRVECDGPAWGAGLDRLAAAVDRGYQALPQALRRDVEFIIRQEKRALDRTRASISMDR
jgi:hypothetical protein